MKSPVRLCRCIRPIALSAVFLLTLFGYCFINKEQLLINHMSVGNSFENNIHSFALILEDDEPTHDYEPTVGQKEAGNLSISGLGNITDIRVCRESVNYKRDNSNTEVGDDKLVEGSPKKSEYSAADNQKNLARYAGNTTVKSSIMPLIPDATFKHIPTRKKEHHWTISKTGRYNQDLFSPPPNEIPKQRFPQVLIIGFAKCGTRALSDFLDMHPNIVNAGPEIHFFDNDSNFKNGLDWYLAQMPLTYSNQITIEKTPAYIWSDRAREEIYKLNKTMKLIIIVKDPVVRLVSHSLQLSKDPNKLYMTSKDGQLEVNQRKSDVGFSIYVRYLQKWMTTFSKSQVYVVEGGAFEKDPIKELEKLETFLKVPHRLTHNNIYFNESKGFYCMRPFYSNAGVRCFGETKGRPHPKLDPEVEAKLYAFFYDYNEELFRFLGQRFQWEPVQLINV